MHDASHSGRDGRAPSPASLIGAPRLVRGSADICQSKIATLVEQRFRERLGECVREAVAVIQAGRMSALSETAERRPGQLRLFGVDRNQGD